MADESPELSPKDDDSNLGLYVVLLFAFGLPLLGVIVSMFTHKPPAP